MGILGVKLGTVTYWMKHLQLSTSQTHHFIQPIILLVKQGHDSPST